MKLFLGRLAILFMIMLMLDPLFYFFLKYKEEHAHDNRITKALEGEINAEILVLGSSRGARDIISSQITKELGKSCFNLSYPGSNTNFHLFVLNTYLKKNKNPKVILLTIDENIGLKDNESLNFRNDILYPLARNTYFNDILIQNKENPLISKFLYTFRLEKSLFSLSNNDVGSTDTILPCGSMPISISKPNYTFVFNGKDTLYSEKEENPLLVKSVREIGNICHQRKIKLIYLFPPNYKTYNLSFEQRVKTLSKNVIPIIRYDTTDPRYRDTTFYYDKVHLKIKGAVVYTNQIIEHLKSMIHQVEK